MDSGPWCFTPSAQMLSLLGSTHGATIGDGASLVLAAAGGLGCMFLFLYERALVPKSERVIHGGGSQGIPLELGVPAAVAAGPPAAARHPAQNSKLGGPARRRGPNTDADDPMFQDTNMTTRRRGEEICRPGGAGKSRQVPRFPGTYIPRLRYPRHRRAGADRSPGHAHRQSHRHPGRRAGTAGARGRQ